MGRPRSKERPADRATSLDYLNGTSQIDPSRTRKRQPFLPAHARMLVRKLKKQEQQIKDLEREP